MAIDRHRANFISSILRALLVLNILIFVSVTIWMFFTSDARDVYVFGTLSCSALIATVGFQLLSRWQRLGFFLVFGVYVCASLILCLIYPDILTTVFGVYGVYVPFATTAFVVILLAVLIFVIKDVKVGKSCWVQMSNGADVKHFRHIYQLTAILLLITGGLMSYLPSIKANKTPVEKPGFSTRAISYELLDSANVTLDEVISIESMIDTIPTDLQLKYNKRIFALKHILLSGIMAKEHDANNIVNICKIHLGEFSDSQQDILDWYNELPNESQLKWSECPPVDNLYDFKVKLNKIIKE